MYFRKKYTASGVANYVPSLSWIVTVDTSGVTVMRLPSLAWSAGSRIKLALTISSFSGIMSFTMDALKEGDYGLPSLRQTSE